MLLENPTLSGDWVERLWRAKVIEVLSYNPRTLESFKILASPIDEFKC